MVLPVARLRPSRALRRAKEFAEGRYNRLAVGFDFAGGESDKFLEEFLYLGALQASLSRKVI
jgi:hypothetical protein